MLDLGHCCKGGLPERSWWPRLQSIDMARTAMPALAKAGPAAWPVAPYDRPLPLRQDSIRQGCNGGCLNGTSSVGRIHPMATANILGLRLGHGVGHCFEAMP